MRERPLVGFFSLYYDPPIGGAERSMHNYFSLMSQEFDIRAYSFFDDHGHPFGKGEERLVDGLTLIKSNLTLDKAVHKFIDEEKPDVIGTMLLGSEIVVQIARNRMIPVIIFVHGLFEDVCHHYLLTSCRFDDLEICDFSKQCPNGLKHKKHTDKLNSCDSIVCNSQYTKNVMLRFFPGIESKIKIAPPHIKPDLFYRALPQIRNRSEVLAVNSMATKGRRIIQQLAKMNPDINFVFADVRVPDMAALKTLPNIEIHGRLSSEEMRSLYLRVGATICPTNMQETFGAVVAESILCGTPVLAMDKGNLKNLVKDGKTGYLMPNQSIDEWSAKLREVLIMDVCEEERASLYNSLRPEIGGETISHEIRSLVKRAPEQETGTQGKKVLFLARFFYPPLGGGEYFNLAALQHLKKLGYKVTAGCYYEPSNNRIFDKANVTQWDGVETHQLRVRTVMDVISFLRDMRPDLVITQSYDAPLIIDAANKLGIKSIIGIHFWRNICEVKDSFKGMMTRPLESVNLLKGNHRVFTDATRVYANSEFMQAATKRYTGIDVETVIHPVVGIGRVLCKGERDPKFITLVNSDHGKGGGLFADIAMLMPERDFRVIGLGASIIKENLAINTRISRLPNVSVVEKTDDMAQIYSTTSILLAPSLVDETFSMVALEAMANGVPLIASKNGNFPYLVGSAGVLLDTDDPQQWVRSINEILDSGELYKDMSERGMERAKLYDIELELDKFVSLVQECIGDPK